MSIQIIGAGFPRTGTTTLKKSLEILGYSKTYHMKELLVNPWYLKYWTRLRDTGTTQWEELYSGYQATVDFPCYPWYKEHLEKYPEAKVILTIRDFDSWYESVMKTVYTAGPQTPGEKIKMLLKMLASSRVRQVIKCIKFFKSCFFGGQFQDHFCDKEFARTVWDEHIAEVKASVKPENLLIYDVRQGWDPLCEFLDLSIPEQELPHLNKKENFRKMMPQLMKGNMV